MSNEYSLVQVIPHRDLGGMQEVAGLLETMLPDYGVGSETISLDELIEGVHRRGFAQSRLAAWRGLRSTWRRRRPDAVLAHSPKGSVYALTAAASVGVGKRLLVIHNNRITFGLWGTILAWALAQTRVATGIVFCGECVGASFDRVPGRLNRISSVIQNGIRLPTSGLTQAKKGSNLPCVVCASRLVSVKNVETIVRACAVTKSRVRLLIFGEGPERESLVTLGRRLDAPVTFFGRASRAELASMYQNATGFLFPSTGEGLPLALIEAAAAGLPVIASDQPFNHEVMGQAAIYVEPHDVAGWAVAIDGLMADETLRRGLSTGSRERASLFTSERMAQKYAAVLLRR